MYVLNKYLPAKPERKFLNKRREFRAAMLLNKYVLIHGSKGQG